ncbi:uridylate-specific endoribonuclease isoform X1 [Haliaeetus albicilla]|uniref:uridylate-specific endoribonuclease isoform X1 n=1 Tax=Haliaeetus albicilla TaxID=8969 RepID=UPI0037E898D2
MKGCCACSPVASSCPQDMGLVRVGTPLPPLHPLTLHAEHPALTASQDHDTHASMQHQVLHHPHFSWAANLQPRELLPALASLLPLLAEGFSSSWDAITDEDLLRISEQLYRADHNKARPTDIAINPQYQASPDETDDQEDRSPQPLYKYINEELFSKPTYASFIKLLDNYQRVTGREEDVTAEELREQDNFLKEVMKTELMKKLFAFLHKKNRYGSEQEFVADLKEMWFGLYSRGDGEQDSSGFEHVFSGEVKKGKVSGFHNWIRFYLLEKQGIVNYFSHNFNGPWDTYPDVLGLQFSWDGFYKEVGSAFIGCSPEFEFGLYTLCFIARPGRACHLSLGGYSLSIQTYPWTKTTYGNGKKYIATAYVISP